MTTIEFKGCDYSPETAKNIKEAVEKMTLLHKTRRTWRSFLAKLLPFVEKPKEGN